MNICPQPMNENRSAGVHVGIAVRITALQPLKRPLQTASHINIGCFRYDVGSASLEPTYYPVFTIHSSISSRISAAVRINGGQQVEKRFCSLAYFSPSEVPPHNYFYLAPFFGKEASTLLQPPLAQHR